MSNFFTRLFAPDVKSSKIDAQTAQVLELEAQKKRLEMERDQISLELENQKKRNQMKLDEEKHAQKLAFDEKTAVFNREKALWETEKRDLLARSERERKEFEERLKAEHELKLTEAVTLAKLDSQQKVKQAELDRDRQVTELRTKQAEELAKVKSDTAEEYYKKMTSAFTEMQLHGDKSTKFVQELALKMFDVNPRPAKFDLGVNVNQGQSALPAPKAE
jgi:hypothetical protein